MIDNNLKVNIAEKRIEIGLSKRKLSIITGISRRHIGDIEAGKSLPGAIALYRLSRAFNCSIDELIHID